MSRYIQSHQKSYSFQPNSQLRSLVITQTVSKSSDQTSLQENLLKKNRKIKFYDVNEEYVENQQLAETVKLSFKETIKENDEGDNDHDYDNDADDDNNNNIENDYDDENDDQKEESEYYDDTTQESETSIVVEVQFEKKEKAQKTNEIKESFTKPIEKKERFINVHVDVNKIDHVHEDDSLTTLQWLEEYSLKAKRVDLFYFLSRNLCHNRCFNVLRIKKESNGRVVYKANEINYYEGDVIPRTSVVDTRYCSRSLPLVLWNDEIIPYGWNERAVLHVNITKELYEKYVKKVKSLLELYEKRIEIMWLSSRRLYGIVSEKRVCFLIDASGSMKRNDALHFVKRTTIRLIHDQLKSKDSFNFIAFNSKVRQWKSEGVKVNKQNIDEAIEWIYSLKAKGFTNLLDGLKLALSDSNLDALYILTDGEPNNWNGENTQEECLSYIRMNSKIRINTILFNTMTEEELLYDKLRVERLTKFLIQISDENDGRYNFYDYNYTNKYLIETDKALSYLEKIKKIKDECIAYNYLYKESKTILEIQDVLKSIEIHKRIQIEEDEEFISSDEWLEIYGLKANQLELFDVLTTCACFGHCYGKVTFRREPEDGTKFYVGINGIKYYEGDAIPIRSVIGAKYCKSLFALVFWNDGVIRHVNLTDREYEMYQDKMNKHIEKYEQRIELLKNSSRELFGIVREKKICFLIDTSGSMASSISFVKDKTIRLLNEQLKSKDYYNFVSFNSSVKEWEKTMIEVNEENSNRAIEWIRNLNVDGSTNLLDGLKFVLSDSNVEAVYLLTDGQPDDPEGCLDYIKYYARIPIHTIFFNTSDNTQITNGLIDFLKKIADKTNGRYNFYDYNDKNYISKDMKKIQREKERGLKYLNQMSAIKNECHRCIEFSRSQSEISQQIK